MYNVFPRTTTLSNYDPRKREIILRSIATWNFK